MAVYESATKVPLLISGPGSTPGLVREDFVSTVDFFPTFLAMAGAEKVLVDPRQTGRDLTPLLRPGEVPWREQIFTEYITHVPWHFYPRYTVREGDWKLIYNTFGDEGRPNPLENDKFCYAYFEAGKAAYEGTAIRDVYDRVKVAPKFELFNLAQDPMELTNLADDPALRETRDRLSASIQEWRETTDDPMLDPEQVQEQERKGLDYREEYLRRQREAQAARRPTVANSPRPAPGSAVAAFSEDFRTGANRAWSSPNNQPARLTPEGMTGSLERNGISMTTRIADGGGIVSEPVHVAASFVQSSEAVDYPIHWGVGISSENNKYLQNMDANTVSVRLITAGPNMGHLWWSLFQDGEKVVSSLSAGSAPEWAAGVELRLSLAYDPDSGEAVAQVHNVATGELLLEDQVVHPGIGGFRFAGFEMTNFPQAGEAGAGFVTGFSFGGDIPAKM